jgi:hypothetical protein
MRIAVMNSWSSWVSLILFVPVSVATAQARHEAKVITIRSGWGGLGASKDLTVQITRTPSGFKRDGKSVDAKLVEALVTAVDAPRIAKPNAANLGITPEWLNAQVDQQKPSAFSQASKTTPGQLALFKQKFTDLNTISSVVPDMWRYTSFDDYPGASFVIEYDDGSKVTASTHSYYVFMIPWLVDGQGGATYNAEISRAVAALLPKNAVNKDRLGGDGLTTKLTEALMSSIETEWNLKGGEELVGGALAQLRQKYEVVNTEITPYHHPEYGTATYKHEPEESNLHATLRKPEFPKNVVDEVVLREDHGEVTGVDDFLKYGERYERLALSVPWLNEYIKKYPKAFFRISYVHDASFGNKALRTFTADMKLRERPDLIRKVTAQQKEIALLMVGIEYSESYWLVFPDKHLMLWRYEGRSGLLKWTTSDFGEGECADYRVNNGGCSGREVSAAGELIPEGKPRDVACVEAWRNKQPTSSTITDALFDIEENGREGFIDRTGKVVIPACFDSVGDFSEGLARFERDGRWGYLDPSGNIVIQPTFPWAEDYHEGLAHVQATGTVLGYEGRWGYIDMTGGIVIPANNRRIMGDDDGQESAFHEGLAIVETQDDTIPPRKGFIDKTGQLAIPTEFSYVYPFSGGLAAATASDRGDSGWGFIDKTGRWVIPPKYKWASSFQNGLAPVDRTNDCAYINTKGEQVLRLQASGDKHCISIWSDFSDGLTPWPFGEKYGYIDQSGKTVISPHFDLPGGFSDGLAAVMIDKKWGYINRTGAFVVKPQFSTAKPFHNGLAQVFYKDGRNGYIDRNGKFIWGPKKSKETDE